MYIRLYNYLYRIVFPSLLLSFDMLVIGTCNDKDNKIK